MNIPELDLSSLASGDAPALSKLGLAFVDAFSKWGFAYVVNHGIPPELLHGIFDASHRFHDLDRYAKLAIALDENHRGYIAPDTSTDVTSILEDVTRPNQSESFMMMREDSPDTPAMLRRDYLAGPNQWPELTGFQEAVTRYDATLTNLAFRFLPVIARALGDDRCFDGCFDPPTTWLRLLHYPSVADHAPGDLYGSAPHTDFGFITLLAQDSTGGLQVATPGGEWIDVPPRKGTLVMNVGDMLHRWSNGLLRSTPHRVINRTGKERYSCVFFFDPNVNTTVKPLDSCVDGHNPSRFEPLVFGEFLRNELQSSYTQHKIETPNLESN